ncbi:MAG TPA: hypothetical protein PK750_11595 [Syntrophales bacterium]|nr:hypothetical protein [Syntrophales bacterium]
MNQLLGPGFQLIADRLLLAPQPYQFIGHIQGNQQDDVQSRQVF